MCDCMHPNEYAIIADHELRCGCCDTQLFSSTYAKFLRTERPDDGDPQLLVNWDYELSRLEKTEASAGVLGGWEDEN